MRRGRWSRSLPPRFAYLCTIVLWFRAVRSERIVGLDVTEYAHAHDRLAQANHLLELAGQEPVPRSKKLKKVADNAAYLRMRARVHDVIGQRLSILHRYLE